MLMVRIFRIVWGWRVLVATATLASLVGAFFVILTYPPQYEARTKVELRIIQPDPVTGFHVGSKSADAYLSSQMSMIRDYQVAVRAAQNLGWLDSPDLQATFAAQPSAGGLDFGRWVARRVIAGTQVGAVPDSNILEIRFRSATPEAARDVADAVRNAYVDVVLDSARGSAAASAQDHADQAVLAAAKLAELQKKKADFERETGVVLQPNDSDLDSDRLGSMAKMAAAPTTTRSAETNPASANQLADIDSLLANATKTFGPNHPTVIGLRQRRATLAAQVAQESSQANSVAGSIIAEQRARASLMAAQTTKVTSQRETLMKLRLMQDEIDLWLKRYQTFTQQGQEQKQLSNLSATYVAPVGATEASGKPVFPNKPLIVIGAGGLGLAAGVLLALLAELLNRRVRVDGDLSALGATSSFAVIPRVRLLNGKSRRAARVRRNKPRKPARAEKPRRGIKQARA